MHFVRLYYRYSSKWLGWVWFGILISFSWGFFLYDNASPTGCVGRVLCCCALLAGTVLCGMLVFYFVHMDFVHPVWLFLELRM